MPRNQTLIQFLSVSTKLPFQISHLTLEWSNSSNSPPRPFVDRARPFPRFQTCNWSHFSSSPWKNTALQYDLWVHLTEACSENLQSFVHGTVDPRRNANCTVLEWIRRQSINDSLHHWSLITFKNSNFYCDKRTDYLLMSFHQKTEKGRVKVRICDGGVWDKTIYIWLLDERLGRQWQAIDQLYVYWRKLQDYLV